MLAVHITLTSALELLATGTLFGFGLTVGNWLCAQTIGRLRWPELR